MNKEHFQNLFIKLDAIPDINLKQDIFSDFGENCYACRHLDQNFAKYRNNIQSMIEWIESGHSPCWEKLEFDSIRSKLFLTGKIVQSCDCDYNIPEHPVTSLCLNCC